LQPAQDRRHEKKAGLFMDVGTAQGRRGRAVLAFSRALGLAAVLCYAAVSSGTDLFHNHHDLPVSSKPECPADRWLGLSQEPVVEAIPETTEFPLPEVDWLPLAGGESPVPSVHFPTDSSRAPPLPL
jgi:hypothetical protein